LAAIGACARGLSNGVVGTSEPLWWQYTSTYGPRRTGAKKNVGLGKSKTAETGEALLGGRPGRGKKSPEEGDVYQ